MKLFSIVVLLIASGKLSLALDTPKVEIKPLAGSNALLEVNDATSATLEIILQNKSGEIVYYSLTEPETESYQKVYDLSEYKPGVYDLIVTSNNVVTEHQLTIADKKVSLGEKQMTMEPFFCYSDKDDILRIAYLNYPGEKMKLKVYDGNELIYNKALDNSFSVNEGLNLSKLQAGQYQIVLAAGSKKFAYPVTIR
ncbi:hypothetical protein C8N47_10111 [Mangrovibacterium marinum]|uniref:Secreted protein (Por secretion system target) n=2 Tax=Mangrovibacterium marinum TaxID=1639118 RepID=A0A2T5C5Y4_9BACT|nr:hypothetical protein C8N47_10111 [Mangrovibacterium marinum]